MKHANITTVPKKGSLIVLENERGIFRVNIIRSILMKMIYNDEYTQIDQNMSDSQMGGRKGKGCRNNLFIINGIIHEVLKSRKSKPVALQLYDYSQMFDSINLKQAISDIFEAGMKNDNLALLYEANKEIFMAVNTTEGLTERQKIENSVLQGDTWGSLLASNQVDTIGQECLESGYGYKYKECLEVGMLGFVDDTMGITEAGYKAQMFNALFNIKTAEKGLQFGVKKCKTLLVGKNIENIHKTPLTVDSWSVQHLEEKTTENSTLIEKYEGQVEIGFCEEQKYLGFVISSTGDNMANIRAVRNKSNRIIRKIFQKLESLKLRKYYFECGVLFLNIMLRSSILYASETYYNLKEKEIRLLEIIEEFFMRKLLNTTKGCPISQMYLELGQMPARFHIYKMRCLFLKYILDQDQKSTIFRFFKLQMENKIRGDWVSTCMQNMKYLNINKSLEEIRQMLSYTYKNMINKKCEEKAFDYLMSKRGSKGSEIRYFKLKMADYLYPNENLTISEQRRMFAVRNKMILEIPSNFCSKENNTTKCICNEKENIEHIYNCKYLNKNEPKVQFENIYSENIPKQKEVLKRFENNLRIRNENKETKMNHVIQLDPLSSICKSIVMD